MSNLSRLVFTLLICSFLAIGCQPGATPTPLPVTPEAVSPTATASQTPEQPTSDSFITADNVSQLKRIASLDLPGSMLNTIIFLPDNLTMLSGDMNGEVSLWELGTWGKNTFLPPNSDFNLDDDGNAAFFGTQTLLPNGAGIVTTNAAGEIIGQDWDGNELFKYTLGDRVYSIAISPDGKYLAAGGLSPKLIIIDLEINQQVIDLSNDYEYISCLVFSPDGKTLLACYERPGNVMKTWETATWTETATFSYTTERFDYHDVLFTPDGKSLVIASTRNDIEFLDLETGQIVKTLQGHSRAPYQIAFSPDGLLLASASDDMTLRIWDVKNGTAVLILRNQHEVGTVAFSPDGKLLAFGVWEEGIQVWALNEELPPTSAASASGEIAFASDLDGDFEIWLVNADGRYPRQLTDNDAMDISPAWSPCMASWHASATWA